MIRSFGLTAATFTLFSLHAQSPEQLAMRQIRSEAIRAHMRFLADDLLEGRGTDTRGYDLAAKYVASQFEGLGLQPGGTKGAFFQVVQLRRMELVPGQSSMTLIRDGREEPLTFERILP
jgi:hypothetical protein